MPSLSSDTKTFRQCILHFVSFFALLYLGANSCFSQAQDGFSRYSGKHVDLISDLPESDEIKELVDVFDKAVPLWCDFFAVPLGTADNWRVTACLMQNDERFMQAGLLPRDLPDFPHGFQLGNQIWIHEQPSAYYRRHLTLHEGTHWFMMQKYKNMGPPWLMEGLAEWFGTHRWDGQNLTMGIIPISTDEVPFWGRLRIIQEQLAAGSAPSLEDVFGYSNTAHRQVEAYAWSWALVTFLLNHPDTSETFQALLAQKMQGDSTAASWMYKRLNQRWPVIRQEWSTFASELNYGTRFDSGMLVISKSFDDWSPNEFKTRKIQSNRNWQATGLIVKPGETLRVKATGSYVIRKTSKEWLTYPDGLTLEYHQQAPIGQLIMAIVAPIPKEEKHTALFQPIRVGSEATIQADRVGEIFFRVNEPIGELADNVGTIDVQLSK